jgi:hypothetical protein
MYHCTTVEILEIIIKRAPSLVPKIKNKKKEVPDSLKTPLETKDKTAKQV